MDRTDMARPGGPLAIVVMGVSGTGKSTLALRLAEASGCPFLEGDDYHDDDAVEKMRGGAPLADEDRWPWLDRLGRALAREAAQHGRAVAACSALKRAYRERLAAASGGGMRFVLLDTDRDVLLRRLCEREGHYMPASLLDSQLRTLERPAADEPVLTLRSDDRPERLCSAVMAWLEE